MVAGVSFVRACHFGLTGVAAHHPLAADAQQLVGMGVLPAYAISTYMGMSSAAKKAEELSARDAAESA